MGERACLQLHKTQNVVWNASLVAVLCSSNSSSESVPSLTRFWPAAAGPLLNSEICNKPPPPMQKKRIQIPFQIPLRVEVRVKAFVPPMLLNASKKN